jgi:hypothetical protein
MSEPGFWDLGIIGIKENVCTGVKMSELDENV